jgi:hypothetical protein
MATETKEIKGAKPLTDGQVNLINQIHKLGLYLATGIEILNQSSCEIDQRWLSIGKTDLQKGLMALERAVAKPEFF